MPGYIKEKTIEIEKRAEHLLWFLIPRPLAAGLSMKNGSRACPGV